MTTTGAPPLTELSPVSSPTLRAPRLDRCRVEALAALGKGEVHRKLAHHRLAGSRRGGDQDAFAVLQRLTGGQLEVVEAEGVAGREGGELGMTRPGPAGGVPLRR